MAPPCEIGLSPTLSPLNPISHGGVWRVFRPHTRVRSTSIFEVVISIYNEIVGYRWGCGVWGGPFFAFSFLRISFFYR